MRIVHIAPGAGDSFYCENCLRDAALFRALMRQGHDVVAVPLYLPLQSDTEEEWAGGPIFFGGINVYLQQKLGLFRRTPRWLDSLFDRPGLLRWVGRRASMTRAKDLGETTISMLKGREGRQVKELNRLLDWLESQGDRPDLVCLSNLLLAGLVNGLKERLGVPVVSLLQDEDSFLDSLVEPYREQAWQLTCERAEDIDGFVSVNRYYAEAMRERLGVGSERMHVVYPGIELDSYGSAAGEPEVPTIGYLSRVCSDKGLDVLVEAFTKLKRERQLRQLRLWVAGGMTMGDKAFMAGIKRRIASGGVGGYVDFFDGFDRATKLEFFRGVSVLCVPERKPIAFALYVLESLAAGVPVAEPAHGVFGELLEVTGGGVLFERVGSEEIAGAVRPLLLDSGLCRRLGAEGRQVVFDRFGVEQTAGEMLRIFEKVAC